MQCFLSNRYHLSFGTGQSGDHEARGFCVGGEFVQASDPGSGHPAACPFRACHARLPRGLRHHGGVKPPVPRCVCKQQSRGPDRDRSIRSRYQRLHQDCRTAGPLCRHRRTTDSSHDRTGRGVRREPSFGDCEGSCRAYPLDPSWPVECGTYIRPRPDGASSSFAEPINAAAV